jgi:serine phosphatase RsbU (regulator of sigma subunit)
VPDDPANQAGAPRPEQSSSALLASGRRGPDARSARTRPTRLGQVVALVLVLGLAVTAVMSWTAHVLDRGTERRLLAHQTRQAASVITSAITGIVSPLQTALGIADATDGSVAGFRAWMTRETGAGKLFISTGLWHSDGTPVTALGARPGLGPAAIARLVRAAPATAPFLVRGIDVDGSPRVVYLLGSPGSAYVVYAERAIPANRRVPAESNPAFADLDFATYLGTRETPDALQTTDVADADLPLSGTVARETIPFGDQRLTLVTRPIGHLGGELNRDLPWIVLLGGVLLSALSALITGLLVRGRMTAETDARTITALYQQLDGSYREMRDTVELLQRALLPRYDPDIPGLEIASRYVAGARGVDIGGDWYTVVRIDDDHIAFAVGDVSGHGVEAAALMGRLHFTLRAYLLEGHGPDVALSMCSLDLDLARDGHMATALVGVGRLSDRSVLLASAGHLDPLVATGSDRSYLRVPTGQPLGIAQTTYAAAAHQLPPGATMFAFTDGLVERRGEAIDVGLQRLADAIEGDRSLSSELDDVLRRVTPEGSEDDIAILALRWTG